MPQRDIRLRPDVIRDLLDQHHLSHRRFARDLEISPMHWSLLVNRHRRLTPELRRRLLDHELIRTARVQEHELWTVDEPP